MIDASTNNSKNPEDNTKNITVKTEDDINTTIENTEDNGEKVEDNIATSAMPSLDSPNNNPKDRINVTLAQ